MREPATYLTTTAHLTKAQARKSKTDGDETCSLIYFPKSVTAHVNVFSTHAWHKKAEHDLRQLQLFAIIRDSSLLETTA